MKLMVKIIAVGPSGSGKTKILQKLTSLLETEGFQLGVWPGELERFKEECGSTEQRSFKSIKPIDIGESQ